MQDWEYEQVEQYWVNVQKDMIHIAHLVFLLTAWRVQTTCVSNTIKSLSKNYCPRWQVKKT